MSDMDILSIKKICVFRDIIRPYNPDLRLYGIIRSPKVS